MKYYTLALTVAILLAYVVLSNSLLYIPTSALITFGFSLQNLLGLLTYSFIHVSPMHLIGNVLLLVPIGIIAEKKLRFKDYFAIFFLSAIVSALAYSVVQPNDVLVGASAAVAGLMAAAFLVDIKKTIVAMIAFSLLVIVITPQVTSFTDSQLSILNNKNMELQQALDSINQQIQNATQQNDTEAVQQLESDKNQTAQDLSNSAEQQANIEAGLQREKETRTNQIIHLVGALTGLAYLFAFRRDIVWEMPSQLMPRKSSRKKSRKN